MSIARVAVVGCGVMGLGIVETVAAAGIAVTAIRATGRSTAEASERLARSVARRVERGKLSSDAAHELLARVTWSSDLASVKGHDLVIETAVEEREAKIQLLRAIEAHLTESSIVATNTSSLPLEQLADALARPDQFVALHFFNPVPAMKLVEVAATTRTAPGALVSAHQFCERIGKTPVRVGASAGYVVNRLLLPMLLQAIETVESGVADPAAIDQAMALGAGHPMGPLALCDLIGLDVVLAMAKTLQGELNDPRYRAPSLLRRLVLAGHLGRKTGKGFFDYTSDPCSVNPAISFATHPIVRAAKV